MTFRSKLLSLACLASSTSAWAAEEAAVHTERVTYVGVSGVWVLANFSYAGMRAQGSPSKGWRIAAFIFGLPGTLITFFAVKEGSERAYGVDVPKRRS
jgi:hypothetical protein